MFESLKVGKLKKYDFRFSIFCFWFLFLKCKLFDSKFLIFYFPNYGRPHRVAPTNNLISRSLAHFSLSLFSFAVCLLLVAGCFCFSNRQSTICNRQCSYLPLTCILSPQGLSITHISIYIIRSRYILIFEENYACFVVLSSLLTPNFNALLNPI